MDNLDGMKKQEIKNWRVLDSEYIAHDPWFTVRKERVELGNGSVIPSYYVFEYPAWICVIAIDKGGRMIMERQYRHGFGRVDYELCAGVVDATDASPLEAAKRELWEETGYGEGQWQELMQVCVNPGTHNNITYCFLATGVEQVSAPHLEETEDIAVELLPLGEVKEILEKNGVMQAIHAAALWKYFALHPLEGRK